MLCWVAGWSGIPAAHAEDAGLPEPRALVAIVIDDLGYRLREGLRAALLPGPLTLSFLPHTPYARQLATLAHGRENEVILHLPMESLEHRRLGPGGLTAEMGREQVQQTVLEDLSSIPFARGLSNHMGSLLTQRARPMRWLMETVRRQGGLYFIDSRTTAGSVAARAARAFGIPSVVRDVFLDHEQTLEGVESQLRRLVRRAHRHGAALGIGHPYPETLEVLQRRLPELHAQGIELVTVSRLIEHQQEKTSWQLSLSLSPRAAKSSRPSPSSICCAAPASRL